MRESFNQRDWISTAERPVSQLGVVAQVCNRFDFVNAGKIANLCIKSDVEHSLMNLVGMLVVTVEHRNFCAQVCFASSRAPFQ